MSDDKVGWGELVSLFVFLAVVVGVLAASILVAAVLPASWDTTIRTALAVAPLAVTVAAVVVAQHRSRPAGTAARSAAVRRGAVRVRVRA